jgi:hypothetical protein
MTYHMPHTPQFTVDASLSASVCDVADGEFCYKIVEAARCVVWQSLLMDCFPYATASRQLDYV